MTTLSSGPDISFYELDKSDLSLNTQLALRKIIESWEQIGKAITDILHVNRGQVNWHLWPLPKEVRILDRSEKEQLLTFIYKLWTFVGPEIITEDLYSLRSWLSFINAIEYVTKDSRFPYAITKWYWQGIPALDYDFWENFWTWFLRKTFTVSPKVWDLISPSSDISSYANLIREKWLTYEDIPNW